MFKVLAAIGREIEYFESVVTFTDSFTESYNAKHAIDMYTSVLELAEKDNNDVARMLTVIEYTKNLPESQDKAVLEDFINCNEAYYQLDYEQARGAISSILGQSGARTEAEVGDCLFAMSMSCDPKYIKEIIAELA